MIIYNPKTGASVKNFPWRRKLYSISKNEMKEFDEEVGRQLLNTYHFLNKIQPENIVEVKKQMKEMEFKCEYCDYETDSEKSLRGHMMGKHKMSKEAEKLIDTVKKEEGVDLTGQAREGEGMSEENKEGIPTGNQVDKDGVAWYGPGLTNDSGMRARKPKHGYFNK